MRVRQANVSDIDGLAELFDAYRRFYGQQSDAKAAREFLLDRFAHQQSVVFVAEDHNESVGFTQLFPSFSSIQMMQILILSDLFVVETYRKRGVGNALLSAATDYARQIGAVRLSLSTARENVTAQGLYEREGWTKDTRFLNYNKAVTDLRS